MVEIEKLVKNKSDIKKAEKQIINFIKEHKIKIKEAPGKMLGYLKKQKPKLYKIWLNSKMDRNL